VVQLLVLTSDDIATAGLVGIREGLRVYDTLHHIVIRSAVGVLNDIVSVVEHQVQVQFVCAGIIAAGGTCAVIDTIVDDVLKFPTWRTPL